MTWRCSVVGCIEPASSSRRVALHDLVAGGELRPACATHACPVSRRLGPGCTCNALVIQDPPPMHPADLAEAIVRGDRRKPEYWLHTSAMRAGLAAEEVGVLRQLVDRGPVHYSDMLFRSPLSVVLQLGLAVRIVKAGRDGYVAATIAGLDVFRSRPGTPWAPRDGARA
jgi:hypothetical protein